MIVTCTGENRMVEIIRKLHDYIDVRSRDYRVLTLGKHNLYSLEALGQCIYTYRCGRYAGKKNPQNIQLVWKLF
jgi:hypothetical protein